MAKITRVRAFANNEVAFVAWELDVQPLPQCLGFHIVREHLNEQGAVIEERPLASYVAFKGQHNPSGLAQNTTVWPVQKMTWRDLTLRRRRSGAGLRPDGQTVRYRVRAVARWQAGLERVVTVPESHRNRATGALVAHTYTGTPIALGYLTPAAFSNTVRATSQRPPFVSAFTNGVLSTQFLIRVLNEDGVVKDGELLDHMKTPGDWLREYLAGDVLVLIRKFFAQKKGRFFAALYELEDDELLALLQDHAERLSLILADAGSGPADEEAGDGQGPTVYDTRNGPARAALRARASQAGTAFILQDRLFNGSGHIGHNKFVVFVDAAGKPQAVLTGSTNWTFSGVAGQSNNCIVINDAAVAGQYLDYWKRLHSDVQPTPVPLSAAVKGGGQGDALKQANRQATAVSISTAAGAATVEAWFSPNMPGKNQPPARSKLVPPPPPAPPPPDMARLFSLMRQARRAIFFLVFMPSRGGLNSIVSQAVALGLNDPALLVTGAISDSQAMWGAQPGSASTPASSPRVFNQGGVSVVRASALADRKLIKELGDFKLAETLTVGKAIIHDKILVIDPMDPVHCVVAYGSHNLGYKASYSNDENLAVVCGHQELALAYTAHVLDVFDHYRFRAITLALAAGEKINGVAGKRWDGFLDSRDGWQKKSSHRWSRYFTQI